MDLHIDEKRNKWDFNALSAVILVVSLIGVEYYLFVVRFVGHLFSLAPFLATFIYIELHFFLFIMFWSYFKVVTTGPGCLSPRINESFSNVDEIRESQKLMLKYKHSKNKKNKNEDHDHATGTLSNSSSQDDRSKHISEDLESNIDHARIKDLASNPILQLQEVGFCFKCKKVKIPRAHHCKNCGRCVVRMDHHCPWTGNCIGLYNHKYFILFLIYGVVLALQIVLWQTFIYLPNAFNYDQGLNDQDKLLVQVSFILSIGLTVSMGYLGLFQIYVTASNVTTIEHHIKDIMNKNPFNKGALWNFEEIFGTDHSTWMWPVKPKLRAEEDLFLLHHNY